MIASLAEQPGLTDRVYSALKEAMFSLELEPGAPLVERDLAERFGISKSPVRDALQRLSGEGLVTQTPYRGMSVRIVGSKEADEFYALHAELEEMAVRLATPSLTLDDLEHMRAALAATPSAIALHDQKAIANINTAFHSAFIRRSGNRVLEETFANFQGRARVLNAIGWRWLSDQDSSLMIEHEQHQSILEAAVAGNAELASERMRLHIDFFRMHFRESWEANEIRASTPAAHRRGATRATSTIR